MYKVSPGGNENMLSGSCESHGIAELNDIWIMHKDISKVIWTRILHSWGIGSGVEVWALDGKVGILDVFQDSEDLECSLGTETCKCGTHMQLMCGAFMGWHVQLCRIEGRRHL